MRGNKALIGFITLCVVVVGFVFLYDYTNIFDSLFIKDVVYTGSIPKYVEPENLQYTDEKYFAFNEKTKEILDYDTKGGLDVVIPKEINGVAVERIGDFAFQRKGINSVIIPEGVKEIGFVTFGYNNLKEIYIPKSVKLIEGFAFTDNQIEFLDLSENDLEIQPFSFGSNKISELAYGKNIITTYMVTDSFPFNYLSKDTIYNYPKPVTAKENEYFKMMFGFTYSDEIINTGEYIFNKDKNMIIGYLGNERDIIIPSTIDGIVVEIIGPYAFDNKNIDSVIIPYGVTDIEHHAFSENNLTNIEIPNNVTSIGMGAFKRNNLTNIEIPKSVKDIGKAAFMENKIESLELHENIWEINTNAFSENNIKKLKVEKSWHTNKFSEDKVSEFEINIYTNNNLLQSDVEIIGANTYYNIWYELFGYKYEDEVVRVDGFIFNKSRNKIINYVGDDKESITIPSYIENVRVESIGSKAFKGNTFENVIVEDGVKYIYEDAFIGCNIKSLKLPSSDMYIYNGAFKDNLITDLKLPKNSVFEGEVFINNYLKTIEIPTTSKFMGRDSRTSNTDAIGTFYSNSNIERVTLIGDDRDKYDEIWYKLFQVGVDIDKVKQ